MCCYLLKRRTAARAGCASLQPRVDARGVEGVRARQRFYRASCDHRVQAHGALQFRYASRMRVCGYKLRGPLATSTMPLPRRCGGGEYGAKTHGQRDRNRKRMKDIGSQHARSIPALQVAAPVLLFGSRERRYTRSLEGGIFMVVCPNDDRGPAHARSITRRFVCRFASI